MSSSAGTASFAARPASPGKAPLLEDYVVLGGQSGLAGHITVGRGAGSARRLVCLPTLPPAVTVKGTPSLPFMLEQRLTVLRQRLPDLFHRVDEIEEQLKKTSAAP